LIRSSIYALLSLSPLENGQASATTGTAFMMAPGVLITAAHLVHADGDSTRKLHTVFEVIGAGDIGQKIERATLVAEDMRRRHCAATARQPAVDFQREPRDS
jgi:hypothetical protein